MCAICCGLNKYWFQILMFETMPAAAYRDIESFYLNFQYKNLNFGISIVPELEIMTVIHSSNIKCIILNVQPQCNGHFCWQGELASPAAEV